MFSKWFNFSIFCISFVLQCVKHSLCIDPLYVNLYEYFLQNVKKKHCAGDMFCNSAGLTLVNVDCHEKRKTIWVIVDDPEF